MKITHVLTPKERADAIKKLATSFNDATVSLLFASSEMYHNLNRYSSFLNQLGIEYNFDDLEIYNKYHEVICKIRNKMIYDGTIKYQDKCLQHDCFKLANYFLLLGNLIDIVEKASKPEEYNKTEEGEKQ